MAVDRMPVRAGLVALAGGGQAGAIPLQERAINQVGTVATANDSVLLPPARAGAFLVVINAAAANSMNVFPRAGESTNALAANAAFAMAANKTALFFAPKDGRWHAILTA